jgi:hypothetical protein
MIAVMEPLKVAQKAISEGVKNQGPVVFVNRLVRTRMLGGVGAGGEKPPATRLGNLSQRNQCQRLTNGLLMGEPFTFFFNYTLATILPAISITLAVTSIAFATFLISAFASLIKFIALVISVENDT